MYFHVMRILLFLLLFAPMLVSAQEPSDTVQASANAVKGGGEGDGKEEEPDPILRKLWAGEYMEEGQKVNPESWFEVPCETFRRGKFFNATEDQAGIWVIRKKRKQIELNDLTGEKQVFKVKWVDDCRMILTFKKTSLEKARMKKKWQVIQTIVETTPDEYVFRGDRNGIFYWGWAEKELSKKEKKERAAEAAAAAEQAYQDSLAQAYEDSLRNDYRDSLKREGLLRREIDHKVEIWEKKRAAEKAAMESEEGTASDSSATDSTGAAPSGKKKKKKEKKVKDKKKKGDDDGSDPGGDPGGGDGKSSKKSSDKGDDDGEEEDKKKSKDKKKKKGDEGPP